MANFSLYISGQTELSDVTEFFQKRLLGEGETPIAFFDGVFYESHQERVGNIVYQDYLIYSDKALYLWARGASKDYLDRFTLAAVSVNSRNKDSAFATMNLKIRREGKEPVFVIFDMVEIREAETIVKLQTVVESTIEDYLGVNFRQEIPYDTASKILQAARNVCPPRMLSLPLETPQAPVPDAGIGYGEDLLEQYRAAAGYNAPPPQGSPYGDRPYTPPGMGAPKAPRGGLESMLPTDPASLKRIADQIKNMVGDAPFKLRDQVMKDLQHVPGDLATVLTALNELLANIAGNPMAERFVMNAIKTAVVNDGVIGSLGKIIRMTGFGSGGGKKSSKPQSAEPAREDRFASRPSRPSPFQEEPDDDPSTIRRRKISVRDDEDHSSADLFSGSDEPITSRENRPSASRSAAPDDEGFDAGGGGGRRKKLSIRMEDDNEIARKLMSYDESEPDEPVRPTASPAPFRAPVAESVPDGSGDRKRKLAIRADESSGANADIARKLMTYDESSRGAVNSLSKSVGQEPEMSLDQTPEQEEPVIRPGRKKIRIVAPEPVAAEAEEDVEPEAVAESVPEEPVKRKIQIVAPEPVAAGPEEDPEPEMIAESVPEEQEDPVTGISEELVQTLEAMVEAEPETQEVEDMFTTLDSVPEPHRPFAQEPASDEPVIPEHIVFAALGEQEPVDRPKESVEYMTIVSDDLVRPVKTGKKEEPQQQHRPSGKAGRGKRHGGRKF